MTDPTIFFSGGLVGMWIGAVGGFVFAGVLSVGARTDERAKAGAEIRRLQEQVILHAQMVLAYGEALDAIDENGVSDPRIEAFRALVRPERMAS